MGEEDNKYKLVYENDPELEPIGKKPTKKNPDVVVEVGQNSSGNKGVRSIEYPAEYGLGKVKKKVERFKAEKEADCSVCKSFDDRQPVLAPPQNEERPLLGGLGERFGNMGGGLRGSMGGPEESGRDRVPFLNRPSPILDRVKGRVGKRTSESDE